MDDNLVLEIISIVCADAVLFFMPVGKHFIGTLHTYCTTITILQYYNAHKRQCGHNINPHTSILLIGAIYQVAITSIYNY
ncbi:hypothetical protein GDO81_003428 [Engystomops pustulosus]|uniref:Uncharacterized protein n=1 Tax=Engystomops pustulosus TaxID=76066 RepID=A0AAV6ZWL7_ENGPU|nr:hypothetical protein GDO81_003428 [Engystomops pustulosus]